MISRLRASQGSIRTAADEEKRARLGRRALGSGAGILGLLFLIGLLLQRADPEEEHAKGRLSSLSYEADGFRGLHELLRRLGRAVGRNFSSYYELPPADRSALFALSPLPSGALHRMGARIDKSQIRRLREWIEEGAVFVAALPGEQVIRVFGKEIALPDSDRRQQEREGETGPFFKEESLPNLVEGVLQRDLPDRIWVEASGVWMGLAPEPSPGWTFRMDDREAGRVPAFVRSATRHQVQAFRERPEGAKTLVELRGRPVAVEMALGRGKVVLVSTALPFTNLALARMKAGPFVVSFLEKAFGASRTVFFDEYSHGLVGHRGLFGWITGTALLYPALGGILLALCLSWRGICRVGVLREPRTLPRRAKEEFVLSLADLFHRAGRYRAPARWMLETYRARLAAEIGSTSALSERAEEGFGALAREILTSRELTEQRLRVLAKRARSVYETNRRKGKERPA